MFQFREGKLLDVLGNPVHFTPDAPVRDTLYLTAPAGLTPTKGDDVAPPQPSVPSWALPLHPLGKASPFNDGRLGGSVEDITETLLDDTLTAVTSRVNDLTLGQVCQLSFSVIHGFMRGSRAYSDAQVGAAANTLSNLLGRDHAIVDSGASFTYLQVRERQDCLGTLSPWHGLCERRERPTRANRSNYISGSNQKRSEGK